MKKPPIFFLVLRPLSEQAVRRLESRQRHVEDSSSKVTLRCTVAKVVNIFRVMGELNIP